jgi:hypothetical protein
MAPRIPRVNPRIELRESRAPVVHPEPQDELERDTMNFEIIQQESGAGFQMFKALKPDQRKNRQTVVKAPQPQLRDSLNN